MDHQLRHCKKLEDYDEDLEPVGEIEFEEWEDVDTAVEVELLVARVQAARYTGA